ncbi:MAG TPA: DegT/DnrJ/EryC1/StrS aminotransferase family protein [Bacilli bacterium]|nr:DegT/DnrJ/EryC1/StrS aminotransferase family protein [Bacilli bacterium]
MIPVYQPYLNKKTLQYAHDALDSTWISSTGKYLNLVEERLQELLGVKHVILTNNGTTATHLVSFALEKVVADKFNNKKIDLIVPNNVYVAAWNAFLYNNKFNLKPIDANIDTWNIDLKLLDYELNFEQLFEPDPLEFERDKAVLIVHNLGNIINVPELQKKYPKITFVEDCCEGFLGYYNNQYAGTSSLASSFSFYGNKTITSGEGGAVAVNDDDLYEYLMTLRGQGQSKTKFIHNVIGYNYRMTNIAAGILYGQLEVLKEIINKKLNVFARYDAAFCQIPKIQVQIAEEGTIPSNWMYGIRVVDSNLNYELAEMYFKHAGIEVRPMFYPITRHVHLKNYYNKKNITNAEILNKQCIILPSYPELSEKDQDYIIEKVKEYTK